MWLASDIIKHLYTVLPLEIHLEVFSEKLINKSESFLQPDSLIHLFLALPNTDFVLHGRCVGMMDS